MCFIILIISNENIQARLMFGTEWTQLFWSSTRGALTWPPWTCDREHAGHFYTQALAGVWGHLRSRWWLRKTACSSTRKSYWSLVCSGLGCLIKSGNLWHVWFRAVWTETAESLLSHQSKLKAVFFFWTGRTSMKSNQRRIMHSSWSLKQQCAPAKGAN